MVLAREINDALDLFTPGIYVTFCRRSAEVGGLVGKPNLRNKCLKKILVAVDLAFKKLT